MLVAAFTGRERILAAYREAVEQRYRFYSYGDAMLIVVIPSPVPVVRATPRCRLRWRGEVLAGSPIDA